MVDNQAEAATSLTILSAQTLIGSNMMASAATITVSAHTTTTTAVTSPIPSHNVSITHLTTTQAPVVTVYSKPLLSTPPLENNLGILKAHQLSHQPKQREMSSRE